jgi:hypothetical protein
MTIRWVGQRKSPSGHIVLICGQDARVVTEIATPFRTAIDPDVLAQIVRDNAGEIRAGGGSR